MEIGKIPDALPTGLATAGFHSGANTESMSEMEPISVPDAGGGLAVPDAGAGGASAARTGWLVGIGLAVTANRTLDISCSNWRHAAASINHVVGGLTGAAGSGASNGANNAATTPLAVTVFGSADIVSGATDSSAAGVVTTSTRAG